MTDCRYCAVNDGEPLPKEFEICRNAAPDGDGKWHCKHCGRELTDEEAKACIGRKENGWKSF